MANSIRESIRSKAKLWNYGSGYRYDWTIWREGGDVIMGNSASDLYSEAQQGDKVKIVINKSGEIYGTETIHL